MAQKSFNTKIDYGDAATAADSTNWTSFGSVQEITPPPLTSKDIETTVLDSPNEMQTFVPGLGDAGKSKFKLLWDATQTATVYSMYRQQKGFRIVYADVLPWPSGSKLMFDGWISDIENQSITKDGLVSAEVSVRVTGLPTFTPAGS
jgi:Lambda phage tail tube protein, TTP